MVLQQMLDMFVCINIMAIYGNKLAMILMEKQLVITQAMLLAVDAYDNNGNAGHVRVYQYNAATWQQIGNDIDGEAADDYSGALVSLSSDGTILAIGAMGNDGNGDRSGHVRCFDLFTDSPTFSPTFSAPTSQTAPTLNPIVKPTIYPTNYPSNTPIPNPTVSPTFYPSNTPIQNPIVTIPSDHEKEQKSFVVFYYIRWDNILLFCIFCYCVGYNEKKKIINGFNEVFYGCWLGYYAIITALSTLSHHIQITNILNINLQINIISK